ncbi:ABC transporter permease [Corticibacter populi]|uniref:ABC transporter permease n=1 Tax=Corticibacter populi TaxID=1550736 RepID=A0A3M6QPH8_9BURK|nr:ABC transporter permease [Corticibacter populi]RMX04925.1 ABC transporter permease [Corticibacter populi]RZS33650.1 nucleoside ABC transporter membrane protein [Corticibacter populi]
MDMVANWLGNAPVFVVPFALAALGLIITEKSGVLAIGAEGLMLVGALAGIGAQLHFGEVGLSLCIAMLAAALVSLLFAFMVLVLRLNQIIAGLALVFFCQGLTGLLGTLLEWTNRPVQGLPAWGLWPLSELPLVGKLFVQNPLVYATPLLFLAVVWVFERTTTGMRLRAVGENPQAADAAGISVTGMRLGAIVAGAMLIGLAGAYISVVSTKLWIADMTGGRGWIAVALVIFSRWSPWKALAGAVLFGCIEALIPQLAASGVKLPQYFMMMTPYIVTLVVMVLVARSGMARQAQPSALGLPFTREERT